METAQSVKNTMSHLGKIEASLKKQHEEKKITQEEYDLEISNIETYRGYLNDPQPHDFPPEG